jgi:hypothetical protein
MSKKIDISVQCSNLNVEAVNYNNISVTIIDVEKSDLLDNFTIKDILDHFDNGELLDEIGIDEVVEHFGLDNE